MRRFIVAGSLAAFLAAPVLAQMGPPAPSQRRAQQQRPQGQRPAREQSANRLHGTKKLMYITRRLDLNEEQQRHVDELLAAFGEQLQASRADARRNLELARSLAQEGREAEQAGDLAKAEEIRKQIQRLRPGIAAEDDFFTGLMPMLNAEQKQIAQKLRDRLDKDPDVTLRPGPVARLAIDLRLKDEQYAKLQELQQQARQDIRMLPPDGSTTYENVVNEFAKHVRELLGPAQVKIFDKEMRLMQPDPPEPKPEKDQKAEQADEPTPPDQEP
ncbi:MAG: hypothetical protein KKB50_19360 [Planctomycetes bacterium]|nr:hypothetical protein [Planctomycetota bacterium]